MLGYERSPRLAGGVTYPSRDPAHRGSTRVLKREAQWLGTQSESLDATRLFPLINVGSSTRKLRESDQPWIDQYVFAPMRRRGGRVTHLDMKPDDGVDIVGDLRDPVVWAQLVALEPRSVLCSNVLEHVTDREGLGRRLCELIPAGGYVIVSVPHAFPYHPDPIDTMFRPGLDELSALFPGTRRVAGSIVDCGTVLGLLEGNSVRLVKKALGMLLSGRGERAVDPSATSGAAGGLVARAANLAQWVNPWLYRQLQATCVVLEKR
jgi:hypothetical protein